MFAFIMYFFSFKAICFDGWDVEENMSKRLFNGKSYAVDF